MRLGVCSLAAAAAFIFVNVTLVGQPRADASASAATQSDVPSKIVGCLVAGLPNTPDARSTASDTTTTEYFVRTPTMQVPPGTTVAVGTPGTTSTATTVGTPVADSYYRVEGLAADQLRPHVGQRVEVQGRLTDNTPGTEKRRVTLTQDKDGRVKMTVENQIDVAGVLHATTIKMVGSTCQ